MTDERKSIGLSQRAGGFLLAQGTKLGIRCGMHLVLQNWFNIARYMADARRLELPLVGGGDHDWNTILTRWDLLQYDTRIAATLELIGWIGIAATCGWVLWRALHDRRRVVSGLNCSG